MVAVSPDSDRRQIAGWLIFCAVVIYGMMVLGGVTRLTGSGLSMVEWKPLMGAIPPLSEAEWQATFEEYQQYPEYQKVNRDMDLGGFKRIFAFEYAHRLLGRAIGVIFFLPFLYFLYRRKVDATLAPKLWVLFGLGALQGLMGWYMVKSGLVDIPRVSQYRLTAHLGLAVVIYGYMLWVAFDLLFPTSDQSQAVRSRLKPHALGLTAIIFIMILSGGLVAGLDAGFVYNTFPLMDGRFFPRGLYNLDPFWRNIFADITTVQFNHRLLAYLICGLVIGFGILAWRTGIRGRARAGLIALGLLLVLQVSLGVATLIYIVPVPLAAAHQAGAIAVLTAALFTSHSLFHGSEPNETPGSVATP